MSAQGQLWLRRRLNKCSCNFASGLFPQTPPAARVPPLGLSMSSKASLSAAEILQPLPPLPPVTHYQAVAVAPSFLTAPPLGLGPSDGRPLTASSAAAAVPLAVGTPSSTCTAAPNQSFHPDSSSLKLLMQSMLRGDTCHALLRRHTALSTRESPICNV